MKKLILIISALLTGTIVTMAIYTSSNSDNSVELPREVQKWESLAENGDTIALHKLLHLYDDNCYLTLDMMGVEEVIEMEPIDCDSSSNFSQEQSVQENEADDEISEELNALYNARIEYWIERGLAINDPVAVYIKGMRLYYTDEGADYPYLAKAAELGNGKAALFCGSAFFNQGRGYEAIKMLEIADELGEPSAGWHLAMCYAGGAGVTPDMEKAVHYLVRSGLQDYPEAVLELKRIDPENSLWQHKADSLKIDFPDFPIIPKE